MTDEIGDFDELITMVIDGGDIEVKSSMIGIGIRASLGDLVIIDVPGAPIERMFVEFFAESKLPGAPENKSLGYTELDVTRGTGVVVADVKDVVYPPSYFGEAIPVDQFLDEFQIGKKLERIIRSLIEELEERSLPSEDWLAQLSSLYEDRLPGRNTVERSITVN